MKIRALWLIPALCLSLDAAGVRVLYSPGAPETGPYPSDVLTALDSTQKTGRRVAIPPGTCSARPLECQDLALLNQLDGFSIQPRIRVRFSNAVRLSSLREGIWFLALDNLTQEEFGLHQSGDFRPVNQLVYDPATQTLYAKPDEVLDQHRRYALIVTDAVRDASGDAVEPDPAFAACIAPGVTDEYCRALGALVTEQQPRFASRRIVAATIFTTLSATAWLEGARASLQSTPAQAIPSGTRYVFPTADIGSVTIREQSGPGPDGIAETPIPGFLLPQGVRIAFHSFRSPSFLTPQQFIPITPSAQPVAAGPLQDIFFQTVLPGTPKPPRGYPVILFGHGFGGSRIDSVVLSGVYSTAGFATIGLNAVGHGGGPGGGIRISDRSGNTFDLPSGGRTVDLDGNGNFDLAEGCALPGLFGLRDCLRQTAMDFAQLTRILRQGLDVDGDGSPDIDPSRIYYSGASLGGMYGPLLLAIEPDVRAAVFTVGGGPVSEVVRTSPTYRPLAALLLLAARGLLNRGFGFEDNAVLRYQPVLVNDVAGAIPIQEAFERTEWFGMPGDPIAAAPHLKSSTLPGVPIKPVLFQYASGDRTVPNPAQTALVRAANMRESTRYLRYDRIRRLLPDAPSNPHGFLSPLFYPPLLPLSLATLQQQAGFLFSGGLMIPDVNPALATLFSQDVFVLPDFLTEDYNF